MGKALLSLLGALLALPGAASTAQDRAAVPAPRPARPPALTAEEKEILKHKELLENLELLLNFEKVKYLEFLGDRGERRDEAAKDEKAKDEKAKDEKGKAKTPKTASRPR